jgi:hypothetical protein
MLVLSYMLDENLTGTGKANSQINSRLLGSFCCANGLVVFLYIGNYGE